MFWDIFSSEKTVDKAVNLVDDSIRGIGNWIDGQQFTEQERSEATQKVLDFRLKVLEKTNDESSARSISRRILAWLVCGTFIFLLLLSVVVYPINKDWSTFAFSVAGVLAQGNALVLGFYFVGQIGNSWIEKAKK